MGKIALVFPGQGAQFPGMGKDLYDKYGEVKELYDKANQILGINIRDISFDGTQEEVTESKNAQPCIFLYSVACYKIMKDVTPSVVAGHSLGEYTALFVAGVLEFDDTLHLVRFRGELMSRAGEINPGTMSAIIGMNSKRVDEIISKIDGINIANYNSPIQTVISGTKEGIEIANKELKSLGAKVIPLRVSGAFHSPLMEEAFTKFKLVLSDTKLNPPLFPVVPNATGKLTSSVDEIREALMAQILSPVRWVDSIQAMIDFGVDTFIELGPGKVLSGLIRQINPEVKVTKPEV
jgi:[acyl-carrier-protein] S-malonyltransferase